MPGGFSHFQIVPLNDIPMLSINDRLILTSNQFSRRFRPMGKQ
jgi:hypothetical protein